LRVFKISHQTCFEHSHIWTSKIIAFLVFQMLHRTAAQMELVTECFLFANQNLATDSKSDPNWRFKKLETEDQILLATMQSKNKWEMVSGSEQNSQEMGFPRCLFSQVSLNEVYFVLVNVFTLKSFSVASWWTRRKLFQLW
jgi:hypothetical protein